MTKGFTEILGVKVSVTTYANTLEKIERWIRERKREYVCVSAVHLVMECQKDRPLLRGVNRAGLVTPDGMPLVWLSRLYGHGSVERVYGPTLMQKLCEMAEAKRYKVFLLGGTSGQSIRLRSRLIKKYQGLKVVGAMDTPVRPITASQNSEIIKLLKHLSPDIVFVGLGCPWQEKWMIESHKKVTAAVFIGVGAAFDFLSGDKKQAPVLIQNSGLEWLFRLTNEPTRLWRRYSILNFLFLMKIILQLIEDFILNRNH